MKFQKDGVDSKFANESPMLMGSCGPMYNHDAART